MKNTLLFVTNFLFCLTYILNATSAQSPASVGLQTPPYLLERDTQVAKEQPGPHNGGGTTVGYSFFENAKDYHTAFRKRVLKPSSSIGYHFQEIDEIYYILEGKGTMQMNGETFVVQAGDAILTRSGSSHGIAPLGAEDLVILIVYDKKKD